MLFKCVVILHIVTLSVGFPDGAPADVCVKERANEPHHGAARSQNINSLPYEIRATSDNFHAGQSIKGAFYSCSLFEITNICMLSTV